MNRRLHIMNALLLVALVGGSLMVYPELPDRIPVHFGADGAADRWDDRSWLSWMLLPLISLATTALLTGIGITLPSRPQSINMPDRKKLLELPPHLQRWVIEGVSFTLYLTTFAMLGMFAVIQYGAYRTAITGDGEGIVQTGVILGLVVLPFITLSSLLVMQKRMDAAWRQHREEREA